MFEVGYHIIQLGLLALSGEKLNQMHSSSTNEGSELCPHGCCPSPFLNFPPSSSQSSISNTTSTSAAFRHMFAEATSSSIFPNSLFTNHESLPSLQDSFSEFIKVYPQYSETEEVDQIRTKEYCHLRISNHTCLDYIGIGLFSYHQLQHHDFSQTQIPSTSHSPPPPRKTDIPLFSISYKTGDLKTQLLNGGEESAFECVMKKRIMSFLNISETDYSMVFTANRASAFKVLAESYPFKSSNKLLTVYDYESEAEEAMVKTSKKRGARVMSAEFSWPRLRINSAKLRKMIVRKRKKRKKRGLFVFPLYSRVTGSRYLYLWMSIAQENGWHILIDACALGPKDMDSFGLSLIRPDFLICSFYKVFGDNPAGFGCLFVKKTTFPSLESSNITRTVGLVPITGILGLSQDSSDSDHKPVQHEFEEGESSYSKETVQNSKNPDETEGLKIECRCLDQIDSLGIILTSNRARYLINWLVNALMKLKHPNTDRNYLVKIYGPRVKFNRVPALAFNVFDWKGEKIEPVLVQKLADRSNISLRHGFLHNIWFSAKNEAEKPRLLETKDDRHQEMVSDKMKGKIEHVGVTVVTAALGFLANFEDTYRVWAFVAHFLDADFVEKERWRYTLLNQKAVEI